MLLISRVGKTRPAGTLISPPVPAAAAFYEPEGPAPGISDNKLLTALMSDAQAGQPFQPTDGSHEPPGIHDGITLGSSALADLHAGYIIIH
jgi:hypothetical protein